MDEELLRTIVGNASTGITLCVLAYFALQGFTLWLRFQRDKWEDERHDRREAAMAEHLRQHPAHQAMPQNMQQPPVAYPNFRDAQG